VCLQLDDELASSQSRVGSPFLPIFIYALTHPCFDVEERNAEPPCSGDQAVVAQNAALSHSSSAHETRGETVAPWILNRPLWRQNNRVIYCFFVAVSLYTAGLWETTRKPGLLSLLHSLGMPAK
jgi:hypothetical protein